MQVDWQGVFPAATTQFTCDQQLDVAATARHLEALVASGVHGMIVLGTVGENCSLEWHEKLEITRAAVELLKRRVPVLVGVAECTTSLACRFAEAVQAIGVDGLMLLPAMIYKSDARETIAHFRAVARSVDLPIMCYNNPVTYSVDITPEMFAELADEPRFVAIKESSDDPRRVTDIVNRCGRRYRLFAGVDDLAFECAMLGVDGWVSGLVNAFPAENCLLWKLVAAGRIEEALQVYRWYTPLLHLDTHPKLVQYIKLAAAECGYGTETVRPPRLPLIDPERAEILRLVRRAIKTRPTRASIEAEQ